jgi:flagellar biosynthesis GTPase FlhF
MNVQVIRAETRRDLLNKTRKRLGPDALILSVTKKPGLDEGLFQWEAVVAIDETGMVGSDEPAKIPSKLSPMNQKPVSSAWDEMADKERPNPNLAPVLVHPALASVRNLRDDLTTTLQTSVSDGAVQPAELLRIAQRLVHLETEVLANIMADLELPARCLPVLKSLYDAGYPEGDALRLLGEVGRFMQLTEDVNLDSVMSCLRGVMEREIRVCGELVPDPTGLTVLVGSSGAGKTALLAKLAADMSCSYGIRPILGVLMPNRAIGVAMVRRYAEHLNLEFVQIRGGDDLERIHEVSRKHRVILDTPGVNPLDGQQLNSLKTTLERAPEAEIHAVVPATRSVHDFQISLEAFSLVGASRFCATRLDEAPYLGRVLTAAFRTGMPISYLSSGTRIPEDLLRPNLKNLVRSVFDREQLYAA